ncbi:MAG: PHP domain-containing protein [Candidatus Helarchaeota archaeon]
MVIKSSKFDLHLHTTYSDGSMNINDAIKTAKEKNLTCIAITDHFTTSWKAFIIDTINFSNFDKYRNEILELRRALQYNCLVGIEIDMESDWNEIKKIPFENFEIILFEYVHFLGQLKSIENYLQTHDIKAIMALAHNYNFRGRTLEVYSRFLTENNICFELNSRYLPSINENLLYMMKFLKDSGVIFTIGSDAHTRKRIGDLKTPHMIIEKIDGYDNLIKVDKIIKSM